MTKGEYDEILDRYGTWNIDKLRVVRRPLAGYGTEAIAQAAQGLSKISKKDHIDKFFHLYTEMALVDPVTGKRQMVMLEKNQTLRALDGGLGGVPEPAQGMAIDISPWGGKRTLAEYERRHLDHHVNVLGKSFHNYSVRANNCQSWTTSGLDANGLSSSAAKAFVNQPLEEALPSWFGRAFQPITDLSAKIDRAKDWFSSAVKSPILEHIRSRIGER